MQIAYATTFDATDVHNWSGTPYYMAHYLSKSAMDLFYVGNLKRQLPPLFKPKQLLAKFLQGQRESPRFNVFAAQQFSAQLAKQLNNKKFDAIMAPLINPIAYLNTDKPIYLWTDAVYASLVGFYPRFSSHSAATITQGNAITAACFSRCTKIIFSSSWAAQSAIQLYGVAPEKVAVVPFGANLHHSPTFQEIKAAIQTRDLKTIKLLFLAKSWERKGGEKVLAVADYLHRAGVSVELNLVGITPKHWPEGRKPPYVNCLGFISKHTEKGRAQLNQLLLGSHFLIVPSLAEAYGIVFCEANAYGLPCLTTHVGGIGTIIQDGVNGFKYALDAPPASYAADILTITKDNLSYRDLALSAFNEYQTRLNWSVAVDKVKALMRNG